MTSPAPLPDALSVRVARLEALVSELLTIAVSNGELPLNTVREIAGLGREPK